MSRIRSQLDSILGTQPMESNAAGQVPGVQPPRPAYPQQNSPHAYQPAPAQAAPAQQVAPPARPGSAELDALHQSLDQLSRKIAGMPKPDVFAAGQSRQQADAALLNAQNENMNQVLSEMRSGFTGMRQEVNQTAQSIHTGISNTLAQDLKRISDGIAALQNDQNMHPDYVDQMQAELSNLNSGIGQLLEKPVSQIDLSGVTQAIETNYSDLVSRLDLALTQRGNEMPAIDVPDYSSQFETINSRLEEMTRAVVSLTVNPDNTIENHAFERIEARLASLAKTVDELSENTAAYEGSANPASKDTDTIAAQIATLSEKLDNLDGMGAAGDALGQEIFPGVTELAARIDSLQNDVGLIASNLDKAFNDVSMPALAANGEQNVQQNQELGAIEQHLSALAAKIDELTSGSSENPNASGQEVLSVLRELVGRVEGLEKIAASAADPAPVGEIDGQISDDRFGALEANLAQIAGQLGSLPSAAASDINFAPITERLDNIEGQIAASRDIVIDIATEAAQRAVAGGAGGEDTSQALAAMMEEIRSIRTERDQAPVAGHEHSGPQLAEIGSTMAAIVDRLSRIEENSAQQALASSNHQIRSSAQYAEQQEMANAYEAAALQMPAADPGAPAIEPDFDLTNDRQPTDQIQTIEDAPSIDPSMDMAEDADFALAQEAPDADFGSDGQQVETAEDVPLAPGSGMPDLETLVQRATRKKKAQAGEAEEGEAKADDGLSDLMAAARRAAQAASVEAETAREAAPKKKKRGLPLGGKLPGISKPTLPGKKALLMSAAAIAVVAGGLFVSQNLFGGSNGAEMASGFETSVETDDNIEQSDLAGDLIDDESDPSTEEDGTRTIDLADGSTLLSPEPDGSNPQVLGEDQADLADDDALGDASTQDGTPVQSASLPAAGELPSEDLGNLAFRQAVASGDGDALFEAGRRFTDGQIVPRDLQEAVKWYTKAAKAGHAPAQYRLGNFYEKGHGVEANPAEAVKWYDKAAAQGNALAMHNLAVLNAMGVVSGDADMPTAVSWFEKAADLGVKDSQVNLGILFTKGMGVQEDLERAYKWFAIAAKGGDADAAKKRDTVAQAMRPEQLEKARGAAEIWKPAKLDQAANVARVSDDWKPALDTAKLTKAQMVKLAQELLTKAGFDAGPADGMMGDKTRNAIAAFQEANGLPVDGTVSPGLMEALATKVNI